MEIVDDHTLIELLGLTNTITGKLKSNNIPFFQFNGIKKQLFCDFFCLKGYYCAFSPKKPALKPFRLPALSPFRFLSSPSADLLPLKLPFMLGCRRTLTQDVRNFPG